VVLDSLDGFGWLWLEEGTRLVSLTSLGAISPGACGLFVAFRFFCFPVRDTTIIPWVGGSHRRRIAKERVYLASSSGPESLNIDMILIIIHIEITSMQRYLDQLFIFPWP
jgi:hypothetical protein